MATCRPAGTAPTPSRRGTTSRCTSAAPLSGSTTRCRSCGGPSITSRPRWKTPGRWTAWARRRGRWPTRWWRSGCARTPGTPRRSSRRTSRRKSARVCSPASSALGPTRTARWPPPCGPIARSLVPLVRGHLAVPRVLVTRADLFVLLGRELILGGLRAGSLRALIRLLLLAFDGALEAFLLLWVHAAYLPGDTLPRTGRSGADRGRVGSLRRG